MVGQLLRSSRLCTMFAKALPIRDDRHERSCRHRHDVDAQQTHGSVYVHHLLFSTNSRFLFQRHSYSRRFICTVVVAWVATCAQQPNTIYQYMLVHWQPPSFVARHVVGNTRMTFHSSWATTMQPHILRDTHFYPFISILHPCGADVHVGSHRKATSYIATQHHNGYAGTLRTRFKTHTKKM